MTTTDKEHIVSYIEISDFVLEIDHIHELDSSPLCGLSLRPRY